MRGAKHWGAAGLLLPCAAQAHSFGRVLTLPVPLWLYLFGSAAALLLSFVVLGLVRGGAAAGGQGGRVAAPVRPGLAAWIGIGLMGLAIATGLAGSPNPYRNFSMTWFWVVFLLGGLYGSAIAGDRLAWINPWRTLLLWIERVRPSSPPARPSHGVALAFYLALIGFELFGHGSPRALALMLVAYTLAVAVGGAAIGGRAWLERGELFHAYFAVGGQLAPSRRPALVAGPSTLLFVLFMLSSTAFDGLKETVLWNTLYWQRLAPAITPWFGGNLARAYPALSGVQDALNFMALALSPLVYLALCGLALAAMRALMDDGERQRHSARALLLALAPTLVPIAVAYNAAHYFTLLAGQGSRVVALLLDPFGWGTVPIARLPAPSPLATWHAQVAIILAGHVLGMAWCHRALWLPEASRSRNGVLQLPLLVLMVVLTASGLWVMSLPVNPSRAL